MEQRKNQWFNEVAHDLAEHNLTDEEINRIAADYELMAEASRLANKFGINLLCIGSTDIKEGSEQRYLHGSIAGDEDHLIDDITIAMINDSRIAGLILTAARQFRDYINKKNNWDA